MSFREEKDATYSECGALEFAARKLAMGAPSRATCESISENGVTCYGTMMLHVTAKKTLVTAVSMQLRYIGPLIIFLRMKNILLRLFAQISLRSTPQSSRSRAAQFGRVTLV